MSSVGRTALHEMTPVGESDRVWGRAVPFDAGRNEKRFYFLAFLVFLVCVLAWAQLHAQVSERTLSGRVTSPIGARISNAHITIKNTENGEDGLA